VASCLARQGLGKLTLARMFGAWFVVHQCIHLARAAHHAPLRAGRTLIDQAL
jgi:hypothetical protein